jgi:hypothetical protein
MTFVKHASASAAPAVADELEKCSTQSQMVTGVAALTAVFGFKLYENEIEPNNVDVE